MKLYLRHASWCGLVKKFTFLLARLKLWPEFLNHWFSASARRDLRQIFLPILIELEQINFNSFWNNEKTSARGQRFSEFQIYPKLAINPLSINPTKWSIALKQFLGKQVPTRRKNYRFVFGHYWVFWVFGHYWVLVCALSISANGNNSVKTLQDLNHGKVIYVNRLSANPTTWSNTLKQLRE